MLAEELIDVHEKALTVPPFAERHPGLTAESGYAAARALHDYRLKNAWRPIGRKVGFTNRTLWERYGVREPMWGTVYDRTLIKADNDRATVPLEGLVQPRIEPEIAFKLAATPKSADPKELLRCIEWMAHSVEIVQCHHPNWKVTIADCTTDNGLHGRLIVGTPVAAAKVAGLAELLPFVEARLYKGALMVDKGVGANVLGSPLLALAHLVELLKRQPEAPPLLAGEIVTTGVLTDAHPAAAGDEWRTQISGLPLPGLKISFR
ncbi:MAG TPA: decarboxylase [Burkholderiales bacterium]|nr:decarboxylase [Burkholderiales bacterium]